jgi:thiosulfate/3-mercaptopyruvate sulfurtransferase
VKVPNAIVECDWLFEHLNHDQLILLDATIPKVTAKENPTESNNLCISSARFFDIKGSFSDANADFPNTMVSPQEFEKEAQALGINKDSCIIVYDEHGIYSSPRAWWMFRSMGFENIAVLNGGLPAWKAAGFPLETKMERKYTQGDFKSKPIHNSFVDADFVFNVLNDKKYQVFDARSLDRFLGTTPEPRAGVRSGHIPNAKSLPYFNLLNGKTMKPKEELQSIFQEVSEKDAVLVFSCGTGITACVLALGAEISEVQDFKVYDGSWTEWGSLHDLPIET